MAGFGFASAGVAAISGGAATATVLGITLGPVGWLLLALAFLGAAIYCAIQAFGTDDKELTAVEYWLDNGVFGKRARVTGEYLEKHPFAGRAGTTVLPFPDINDELYQLQRITLVAQASLGNMRSGRSDAEVAEYSIALPRYTEGTELQVTFYGFEEKNRIKVSSFSCKDGQVAVKDFKEYVRLTGGAGRPELKTDSTGAAYLSGRLGSVGTGVAIRNFLERVFDVGNGERFVDVKGFGLELTYKPDRHQLPALETVLRLPEKRR